MKRCPECGRGGGRGARLSAPALLHLAAEEVAEGRDMAEESIENLVMLRRVLHKAEASVNRLIEDRAEEMVAKPYQESRVAAMKRRIRGANG